MSQKYPYIFTSFGWFKNNWIFISWMNCSIIFFTNSFLIFFIPQTNPVFLCTTKKTLPNLPYPLHSPIMKSSMHCYLKVSNFLFWFFRNKGILKSFSTSLIESISRFYFIFASRVSPKDRVIKGLALSIDSHIELNLLIFLKNDLLLLVAVFLDSAKFTVNSALVEIWFLTFFTKSKFSHFDFIFPLLSSFKLVLKFGFEFTTLE